MKAYYFSSLNKKLRYGDNRQIRVGQTHKVTGDIKLCQKGLHASIKPLDALKYAPGSMLWLVELSGEIIIGDDKCVASERTYICGFNAEELLREFARKQALINIDKIKPYTKDYDLIYKYLTTGDKSLKSAAWSAARSAARSARSAAWSVADSAARSARSAADSAADSAAWSAAQSARSAAWSVADSAANKMLQDMIENEFNKRS